MDNHAITVEKLIEKAHAINGPDDYSLAKLVTCSCISLIVLFCLQYWKPSDAELLWFIQFFWPNARHGEYLVPLLIMFILVYSIPLIVVWRLMKRRDRNRRDELVRILDDALSSPDFSEYLKGHTEGVILKRVRRVRRYENDTGRAIVAPAFASLFPDVVPAESVEEGRLAHVYRSLPKDTQLRLSRVCPKIVELKIGVVQTSPLDAFRGEELR